MYYLTICFVYCVHTVIIFRPSLVVLLELMAIAKKDSVFVSKRQGQIQVYGKGGGGGGGSK